MTGLPETAEQLLKRLDDNTRAEMDLVRELGEAIRRADDQLLKEVRTVTRLHEMRREAIFGELQTLASQLCALPHGSVLHDRIRGSEDAEIMPEVAPPPLATAPPRVGDWRAAAERIDSEIAEYFNGERPHH